MNSDINRTAQCYVGYYMNNPVCFFAVLHFPHQHESRFKKGHRLVVLPDYQGLGIGHKFSTAIAQHYIDNGYRFIITSSTKSLFTQRKNDARWIITRSGRVGAGSKTGVLHNSNDGGSFSRNKLTYSYEYIGIKNKTDD